MITYWAELQNSIFVILMLRKRFCDEVSWWKFYFAWKDLKFFWKRLLFWWFCNYSKSNKNWYIILILAKTGNKTGYTFVKRCIVQADKKAFSRYVILKKPQNASGALIRQKAQCVVWKKQGYGSTHTYRMFCKTCNKSTPSRSIIDRWRDDYRVQGRYQQRRKWTLSTEQLSKIWNLPKIKQRSNLISSASSSLVQYTSYNSGKFHIKCLRLSRTDCKTP